MTIKIQDLTQTTTFIQSASKLAGENMPRVFFSYEGWEILPKPRWITKFAVQREGNFKKYNGSDDAQGSVTIILYGTNRKTDLETLKNIKEPIYFDADDYDSNISGNYIMQVVSITKNEFAQIYDVKISLEGYNN